MVQKPRLMFFPATQKIPLTYLTCLWTRPAIWTTVLLNEQKAAGFYAIKWNAGNLSSGMYVYRLESDGKVLSKKMLLFK